MSFMAEAGVISEPPFFTQLRTNDWLPEFHYEVKVDIVADLINRPHEDYPDRVPATKQVLLDLMGSYRKGNIITNGLVRWVHASVFPDHGDTAGHWRHYNVRVADHVPPKWEFVEKMMGELQERYSRIYLDAKTLKHWYYDFETIHPFRDGNGRTAGIIVAVISRAKYDEFLVPGQ